jgi:hypothetical protein
MEELHPDDPRWVDFDPARGRTIIDRFARDIRWAKNPSKNLFAGHRGIGKTSELYRLKRKLETTEQNSTPFLVMMFDATETLDSNDLDFPDLLALVAEQVQTGLRDAKIPGFSGTSTRLSRLYEDFLSLLGSTVHLSKTDIEVPFAKLGLEFRSRPASRQLLRSAIEAISTNLLEAVNQLLDEATSALKKSGRAGLVLIIDGLEKVVYHSLPEGRNTHTRLFIDRSESLARLNAHTVYTIPLSMCYSPQHAVLAQAFGKIHSPMSMIRVRDQRDQPITPQSVGMQKLREMLDLRCKHAGVTMAEAFEHDSAWQHLSEMSGGHLRQLFTLLSDAAYRLDSLPITRSAIDQAVNELGNSFLREVPDLFWAKLKRFDVPTHDTPKDDDHQLMLHLLHIFEYGTERAWYEVNPILRTLDRLK